MSFSNQLFLLVVCLCSFSLSGSYFFDDERMPIFLSASVGDHIVFNCDIEFPQDIPIPYVLNWKKGEKVIFSWDGGVVTSSEPFVGRIQLVQERFLGFGKASINLTAIRESDGGWYECKVIFPFRTPTSTKNGTWFYLTVNGGNLLEIPPINQTVMEGDEAHFSCIAKDVGIEIRWFKDGVPIIQLDNLLRRSKVDPEGSLTIHTTEMGDLGEYVCEAVNNLRESQSARAYLNVQYKAKVIYAPKEIFLPFGQPAILDCHFRANPPLKSLRWEKDGFLFDPYNVPGVFYKQNGSLYFSKVDDSHNGQYSCTPYNELGTEGPSPNIHVMVLRPPAFTTTPHHLYLRKLGETLELICDARDGENGHKPIIVWYKKDGTAMPEGRYALQDGNLTITNIQEEDRGLYQCSATNEAATITTETELLVENVPPRAPYNLTARASTNSIQIKWAAGRKRPNIKYSVWYRSVEAAEWRNVEIHKSGTLEATIYNLLAGHEYEFMVLSEDPYGEALFSKPLRSWTLGFDGDSAAVLQSYSSIGHPLNVSVQLSRNGHLVTWAPPDFGQEYLHQYILKWYETSTERLWGSVETGNTSYLVTNLDEGGTYDFQVIAIAIDDYEAVSERVTFTVPAYQKIKLLSLSLVGAIALVIIVVGLFYYIKLKWCQNYCKQSNGIKK